MSTLKTTNLQHASAASPAIVLAADGSATAQLSSVNGGPLSGTRNRIINGDMRIAQRGTVAFSTVTSLYGGCDRWRLELYSFTSASGSVQRAGSLGATTSTTSSGFVQEAVLTTTGSGSIQFVQRIEGQNCNDLNGKTVTLAFSVFQDTGSAIAPYVQILKPGGLDNWSSATVIASSTLSSLPSGILTKYTYTTTLGSSDASNGLGVAVGFSIGAVTGKYFQIADVQLEAGTVATPFERRSYGQELALCQRYFYKSPRSGNTDTTSPVKVAFVNTAGTASDCNTVFYPVEMRTSASLTVYNLHNSGTAAQVRQDWNTINHTVIGSVQKSYGFSLAIAVAGNFTASFGYDASAEL